MKANKKPNRQGYSVILGMVCAKVIRKSEYLSSITAFRLARLEINTGNLEAAASRMRSSFDKVVDDKERKVIGAFLDSKEFREKINNAIEAHQEGERNKA